MVLSDLPDPVDGATTAELRAHHDPAQDGSLCVRLAEDTDAVVHPIR
jgi:hypothetical protein